MRGQKRFLIAFAQRHSSGALLAILLLCGAGSMTAGELSGCGTCQGSVYYLTYAMLQQNVTMDIAGVGTEQVDVVRVFYTVDTTGYDVPSKAKGQVYLNQVAEKVSTTVYLRTLYDAPNALGEQGHPDLWTLEFGGLNANGCNGSGAGFECSDFISNNPPGVAVPNGNSQLQWVFDDVIPTGTLLVTSPTTGGFTRLSPTDSPSIKARYVDTTGNKVGALVSEHIGLTSQPLGQVPEPASFGLLLTVVGVAASSFIRSRHRRG